MSALRRDIPVAVTDHARDQARSRFAGFKAARIVDEVRDALTAGRFSPERPAGLRAVDAGTGSRTRTDTFYCWTRDQARVYAIRPEDDTFVVVTTMPPVTPA